MKFENGLFKSPVDERDILLTTYLKDEKLPSKFTVPAKDISPVRSQGQEGSCVGFAGIVGVKEYQEKLEHKEFIGLSPRFAYEEAKKISGHKEGTTLKALMQVLSKLGVCEEVVWPYEVPQVTPMPPKAYSLAIKYKIKTYARITSLSELKLAIVQFGVNIIGVDVYKTMTNEKAKMEGIVDDPSCWDRMNKLGGHALAPVEYDDYSPYFDNDGHIKVKNSWGKGFGARGYLYLSYKYIKANMMDAFSCVDKVEKHPLTVANLTNEERETLWV